jgi:hypothetical protein
MSEMSDGESASTASAITRGSETHVHPVRPPPLSPATARALAHHVGRAFGPRGATGSSLREVVRQAVAELLAAGATQEMIDAVLADAVREHPDRYRHERVSIITRLSAADALIERVLAWARAREDPTGVPPRNPRSSIR